MQRIGDVIVLDLAATLMNGPTHIHPVALIGPDHTLTLVDTGLPGMLSAITAELDAADFTLGQVRRVVVTHHDLDHIGSLEDVVRATGAEVYALDTEVPYVTGERRAQKLPSPEQARLMLADPELGAATRAMLTREPVRVPVQRPLRDGDLIPGGARVIATPGHTPGHLSLLTERGVLISGDALTSQDGDLRGPMERATPDLLGARASVRKLAGLPDVLAIVTYHGGLVTRDAAAQLRDLAAQSPD